MNLDDLQAAGASGRGVLARDVRLRGFADRASLDEALAWIDEHAVTLGTIDLPVADAVGRLPVGRITARADHPAWDRAGEDGHAVRASETVGAAAYAPALLRIVDGAGAFPRDAAVLVASGAALPPGTDAVVGFDAAEAAGGLLEVIAPVAEGSGVERAGQQLRSGDLIVTPMRPLRPHDVALLASAGVERVAVMAQPRVLLVVAGAKAGAPSDAHLAMLRALIERDGGTVEVDGAGATLRDFLASAAVRSADAVLATGRTGVGPDDDATLALAAAGQLALHGIALRPGGSSGMGRVGETPVLLLPGDPLACLCAYELLAGRLVRRLGGRDAGLPHRTCEAELRRKIVSAVGSVDVCQVRLAGGEVEPIGVMEFGGLASAGRADGFVVVPAALEGYPPGARVTVHLH